VDGVRKRLTVLGWQGKLFELRMPDGIKDPADMHVADPTKFKERLEQAIRAAKPLGLPRMSERNGQPGEARQPKKVEPAKRLAPPPWKPFPAEALPEPARGYVDAASRAIGCDASYIALPLVTALAAAIGNSRVIRLKRGWTEPAVLWAA